MGRFDGTAAIVTGAAYDVVLTGPCAGLPQVSRNGRKNLRMSSTSSSGCSSAGK